MIDRLDWATRRPVWFSIKQHQTFCFHSIASPTNTINQFAVEFVAIAERGGGGGYIAFSVTSSNVLFCIILFKGDFVSASRFVDLTILESRVHPTVHPSCTLRARLSRVRFDWKGLNIFFGGLAPLFGLPWGYVMKVSIRNFMAVKGSRLERNIED